MSSLQSENLRAPRGAVTLGTPVGTPPTPCCSIRRLPAACSPVLPPIARQIVSLRCVNSATTRRRWLAASCRAAGSPEASIGVAGGRT